MMSSPIVAKRLNLRCLGVCFVLALWGIAGGSLIAQQDAAPPDTAPAIDATAAPETTAAPEAVAPADGATNTTTNANLELNFQDAPLDTVLTYLSEVAGFVVIKDASIQGRVTVMSRQPLDMYEAIVVLNSVLKEQGLAAVRTGRVLKIIQIGDAKKANIAVHVGANPDEIEETDEVITQVMPIRNVDAVKLRQDLESLLSDFADATANQNSNSLIITDTSANIRRIAKIITALDTTTSSVTDVQVFALNYANAVEAARLVNDIFGRQGLTGGGGGGRNNQANRLRQVFGGGGRGGPGGDGGDENGGAAQGVNPLEVQVIASADQRTNTVVVGGPPATLEAVGRVLRDLDANPVAEQGVFTYFVRNGDSANMQQVLNSLFGTSSGGGANQRGGQNQFGGRGGNRNRATGNQATIGGGGGGIGGYVIDQNTLTGVDLSQIPGLNINPGFDQAALFQALGLTTETSASANDLLGQVYVEADTDTNSLLVMTNPRFFTQVKSIIEELDKPVPQVLIKVLIAEVTHDDSIDLGVEFSALNIDGGDVGISTNFGVAAATGGLAISLVKTDITAALRALQEVGKLEVLSRPYILASDNQAAMITVGSEVPFITNTRVTETGQTINTITYDDVGIILNVTPHINPDGLVIMDIAPEISAISGETVPISETVNAPVIEKRSAESRVSILNGQTIVIGGLIEDQKISTVRKVPLLGDIPLIGELFKRTEQTKAKTELLIFLTPHVAIEPERLLEITEDEKAGMKIVPGAVEEGAFQEQLEGMRRGYRPERDAPENSRGTGRGALGADDAPRQ